MSVSNRDNLWPFAAEVVGHFAFFSHRESYAKKEKLRHASESGSNAEGA